MPTRDVPKALIRFKHADKLNPIGIKLKRIK